jgi:hypothetical protein
MKNRVINGAMAVDQMLCGTATSTQGYCVDQWAFGSSTGTVTAQQTGSVGANSVTITATSAVTGMNFYQRFEAANVADLAGQTVTVSFQASSNAITSITALLAFANARDNFGSVTTIGTQNLTITSTPTTYSMQFTLPSGAANGIVLNAVNGLTMANGNTITITNVQLEAGSIATSFEHRPIALELELCQRYYYKTYNQGTVPGTASASATHRTRSYSGSYAAATLQFPRTMRAAPTVTLYNPNSGATNSWYNVDASTSATADVSTVLDSAVAVESSSVTANNTYMFHITASARL